MNKCPTPSRIGNQRWKPVMNNDDYPVTEEDDKRHPTIIKNGGTSEANINPNNITTVTWTAETEEKKDEEKLMKDNKGDET